MEYLSIENLAEFEKVKPPRLRKSNFSFAFSLLPKEEKQAINSIYSFFTYIDNIVDSEEESKESIALKERRLNFWTETINKIYQDNLPSPIFYPLYYTIKRFMLPQQYLLTLIEGCRSDLYVKRYKTFEELKSYCYSVASIVGLIVIEIFGHRYEETKSYAINLGYAMQLTNILRDIKKDKDRGYIYLPLEDLEKFGYSEEDLINEVYNDNFCELMEFETKRAREFFHRARTYLHPDERVFVYSAGVMDEIYYRLLEKIELKKYRVFESEIKVSWAHKLVIALKHWFSTLLFIKPFAKFD
ncbi:MAG: squalene/phytoene synthase family protein [Ignavibacteria bacterium]|nr:squalene/phytoene synthase family protein [Ignavibacteria bacterium]